MNTGTRFKLFLFSNKMLVIKAEIHKMLVRIANDQTASSVFAQFLSRQQVFEILEH